ncbi:MAG: hypothetical protein KZQ58_02745 [gamma proteobacterium symbiont of Bathyaustriella thionipta]|nr:hypothetical protein [gamma proteobacterium symbiont of Bathyaustriella thionipta]
MLNHTHAFFRISATLLIVLLLSACGDDADNKLSSISDSDPLTQVPEDTLMFYGGLQPYPLKDYLDWSSKNMPSMPMSTESKVMLLAAATTDGERFLAQAQVAYIDAVLNHPEKLLAEWGVAPLNRSLFYMIGLTPVFRIQLADLDAFEKQIKAIEKQAALSSTPETLGDAQFRRYRLNDAQAEHPSWLIVATRGDHAIITVDMDIKDSSTLAMALEQEKPEKSLAETDVLQKLIKQYDFNPTALGFINHQELVKGLSNADANSFGRMLTRLSGTNEDLDKLRSEACYTELSEIVAHWPRTVFGITSLKLDSEPLQIGFLYIMESNNSGFMQGLRSLRGFIPDYIKTNDHSVAMSMAMGLDMDNLAPFMMKQWTEFQKTPYKCEFLTTLQQDMKQNNPAALMMMTAMVAGVQGISVTLNDIKFAKSTANSQAQAQIENLDGIVTLTAKNPTLLINAGKIMAPELAAIELPADGSPLEMPVPLPDGSQLMLKARLQDSHIMLYTGEKGGQQAQSLKGMVTQSNGFYQIDMNYGKYFDIIQKAMPAEAIVQVQEATQMLESMKNINLPDYP